MKILLTTLNSKFIHTNLGIRCLKSYVASDFDVTLKEFTIKDPVLNIATDIINEKPDLLGFSCYIWNIEPTLKIIELVKKVLPDCLIFIGGPEVSYDGHVWLEKSAYIDLVIEGEGEGTFKELCHQVKNGLNISTIEGIVYREGKQITRTSKRAPLDLSNYPSPYRLPEDIPNLKHRISYVETSRGCPFNCQFCLSSTEQGVRFFNQEQVKDDILYLMQNGAKTIKFLDRTFNTNVKYALSIFSFIIENHKPGNVFQFEITGDILKPEIIDYLNQNAPEGLFRFEIGIQSTNEITNEHVNRRQNFQKLKENIVKIKSGNKIDLHLDLIAGLPKEDYHTFAKTFNDVFELRPEELQFGFLKLLRGTGLRNHAEDYKYVYPDFPPYEILSNEVLSFEDVQRMKQIEDMLEKYWNSGKFSKTLQYIMDIYQTPWSFFEALGEYWSKNSYSAIGHQHIDLFNRLYAFLKDNPKVETCTLESALTYDYYDHYQFKPKRLFIRKDLMKEERNKVFESLEIAFNYEMSIPDLMKYTRLERFHLDLEALQNDTIQLQAENILCITFLPNQKEPIFNSVEL